jgi:hypothetical protein
MGDKKEKKEMKKNAKKTYWAFAMILFGFLEGHLFLLSFPVGFCKKNFGEVDARCQSRPEQLGKFGEVMKGRER